jgi:N-acetylmuramoyl-L-alanine amidase
MTITDHILEGVAFEKSQHVGGRITPRFLVMHYTAGGTAAGSVKAIANRGLSAHLFVDRDGTVIQTVPFGVMAFHAGESSWRGFEDLNRHSVGIEICNLGWLDERVGGGWTREGLGRVLPDGQVIVARHRNGGKEKGWEIYPETQLQVLEELTKALLAAYPTIQEVVGHDDIAPRRKVDPGPAFPMARFQALAPVSAPPPTIGKDLGLFEVVSKDTLNLRGGPGTDFKVLRSLDPGTTLRVLREDGAWRSVDLEGDGIPDGFVHGAFLRRISA